MCRDLRLLCILAWTQGIPVCRLSDITLPETALLPANPSPKHGGFRANHKDLLCSVQSVGKWIQGKPEREWVVWWEEVREAGVGRNSFAFLLPPENSVGNWVLQPLAFLESGAVKYHASDSDWLGRAHHPRVVEWASQGWLSLLFSRPWFAPCPIPVAWLSLDRLPSQDWSSEHLPDVAKINILIFQLKSCELRRRIIS